MSKGDDGRDSESPSWPMYVGPNMEEVTAARDNAEQFCDARYNVAGKVSDHVEIRKGPRPCTSVEEGLQ